MTPEPVQITPPAGDDVTIGSSVFASVIAAALGLLVAVGTAYGTADPAALLPFKVSAASLILTAFVTAAGRGSFALFIACMGAVAWFLGAGLAGVFLQAVGHSDDLIPWAMGVGDAVITALAVAILATRLVRRGFRDSK